jgi:hypothetical protein
MCKVWGSVWCGISLLFVGCRTAKDLPKSDFFFYVESKEKGKHLAWSPTATMPVSKLKINICPYPFLFSKDVDFAQITTSNFGKCILFKLTKQASIEFYKLSVEGAGRKIVFVFDNAPMGLSMPIPHATMDGTFIIFPEIEENKLESLIIDINETIAKMKKLKKD